MSIPHAAAWRVNGSTSPTTMACCEPPAFPARVLSTTSGPIPAGSPIANATEPPLIEFALSEWDREQGVDFLTVSYDDALDELIGCARNIDAIDVNPRRKQNGITGVHDADDQKI